MGIGIWQVILILAIVLILFGAGKLPRVMGDLAKGIKSFRSGMKEEVAGEVDDPKEVAHEVPGAADDPAPSAAAAAKADETAKS
ncbi:MAG: twin-arginine translocase TatA/TatE family subunit [Rhodospirillales bacterium]|nr:twin-arginine translocase TatA/TatE family subunit [Alphaproteobacteria bacterium]MCY4430697.1 twin-arginine translocase TatA/TatE family subunit [Rhodospirillales bacterium]